MERTLGAAPNPFAQKAPGANGDNGLNDVPAGAISIRVGV